jgi:hypothetical protein
MTGSNTLRFRSKIDWWLALLLGGAVLSFPVIFGFTDSGRAALQKDLVGILATGLVPVLLVAWMFFDTGYDVTLTGLRVRCGPIRRAVPLDKISRICATRSIMSAPALSLDRLEVSYNRFDTVVISPADKRGFLAAVVGRAPQVTLERLDEFR